MSELRAQHNLAMPANTNLVPQRADDDQCATRSRPVSLYDNFKDVSTIMAGVTSAQSAGNLSQVHDDKNPTEMDETNNRSNNNNDKIDHENNHLSDAVSIGNISTLHSPKVIGASSTGNIGKIFRSEKDKEIGRAPSMANCLSTTVPVNITASQIAGRHTPTRNSLRHSRMIVMHRTGNIPRKIQQPLIRHELWARFLAAMQMTLGFAITSLSLFMLLWTPNLPKIDNPYWSGIPLLISGSFGICLLCCFKKEYPRMSPSICLSSTKVILYYRIISAFLSAVASIACILACAAGAFHLVRLAALECSSSYFSRPGICVCKLRGNSDPDATPVLKYSDLDCSEVEDVLTNLLIVSISCNALGMLVSGSYCYLHCQSKEKRPQYFQVKTNANHENNGISPKPIYKPNQCAR